MKIEHGNKAAWLGRVTRHCQFQYFGPFPNDLNIPPPLQMKKVIHYSSLNTEFIIKTPSVFISKLTICPFVRGVREMSAIE